MIKTNYKKVYICHPYASDPEDNIEKVLRIVEDITLRNEEAYQDAKIQEGRISKTVSDTHPIQASLVVPVAVHLLFPKFMSEDTFGREIAMDFCLRVLEGCDEIWVYGPVLSSGMRQEITFAGEYDIKIVWKNFE